MLGAPSRTLMPFKTPALPGFPCYCCSLVGSNGSLNAADGEDRKVELVWVGRCVSVCSEYSVKVVKTLHLAGYLWRTCGVITVSLVYYNVLLLMYLRFKMT